VTYIEHKPIPQLSLWIEKLWYCSADSLNGITLSIPLLHHELVFNFSENYRIRKASEQEYIIENPIAWINGLQTEAYYSYSSGKHEMIGVLFKPLGLKHFLTNYSCEFTDTFIDASLVFGKCLQTLIAKIQDAHLITTKISLIETFLIESIIAINPPRYLQYSIQQLSRAFGTQGSVGNICKEISISNKSLIEAFHKHIGISPTKYSHLYAINQAALLLAKEPEQSLTALAYELSFYDQAHFTKLFKSITSLTPSQYSAFVINKQTEINAHNFILTEG
jgi:AraC-like DNA-binding protein